MKKIPVNPVWFFASAFLVVNAGGWWWVKRDASKEPAPAAPAAAETVAAPAAEALRLTRLEQVALSPERQLTVEARFSGGVDWKSFAERFALKEEGKALAWRFVGETRRKSCMVQTEGPVKGDRVTVRMELGVRPDSTENAPSAQPAELLLPVVSEFRFTKAEADTPAFGHPQISVRFTQPPDMKTAAPLITCSPEVAFTVTPAQWWGQGLNLSGAFEPGEAYTLIFHPDLRSVNGYKLEKEARRTVLIPHRRPTVAFGVQGRYLAPEGRLTVPVQTVNTPLVVSSVARVLPQNLVQLAVRETDRYERWYSAGDDGDLSLELTARAVVRTNQVNVVRNQEHRLLLHLNEYLPGPARGVYLLKVDAKDADQESRLLCVTDIGLSVRAEEDAVTAWVTSLSTGQAAPERQVELYGRNNLLLAQGVSDEEGLVRLRYAPKEGAPFLLVAKAPGGQDLTFLALTDRTQVEQAIEADRGYVTPKGSEAFVMSDRDLYRHGETAFVQALLRTWDGRPPAPFPVVLHVIKPDGRTFKTYPLMPDALGAAVTQVTLPEYLPSGTYDLQLKLPGDGPALGQRQVLLEAFVPPQIRVKLPGLPESVRAGDTLAVKLAAEHLFGKPAGGLLAEAEIVYRHAEFAPKAWKEYQFGDAEKEFASQVRRLDRDRLDENGASSYTVKMEANLLPPARLDAVVQGTVFETGGRTVSARATVAFHPYPFYLGLKPAAGKVARVGLPQTLHVAAVNPDGTRHAEPTPLKVRLEQVSWVSNMRKSASGLYQWESERVKTLITEEAAAAGAEDGAFRFTVQSAGSYVLTVADPASGASSSWAFSAGDEGQSDVAWDRSARDSVELVFDKPEYAPGDTARLQIRAPFAGQAWVSLQQARVFENRLLTMTNNTAEIEWTVSAAFAPNVEVAVSVVRPAVAESVWSAHRASGIAPLRVCPPERRLKVSVAPEAPVWRPQSAMPVRVLVTDAAGQPAQGAAVTVLAVDEGVCLLTEYKTPDPCAYFLATRAGGLAFYDMYQQLMPITDDALAGTASHVGGDGDSDLLKRLNPVAARRFKPVALWRANVTLDEKGAATVPFELPEFTGELRLMAVAWDAQAVGASEAPVKIKRKLVVQPDLPRFLAPGDKAALHVALHNESGAPCSARVSAVAEGPLSCEPEPLEVALQAGESRTVSLSVAAREQAGSGQVTVKVEGAGERYEEAVELAVRPAAAWRVTAEHVVLKPGEERAFAPPEGILTESFSQTFYCAAQPTVNLLGALEYVTHYPYGCLEQTVSSVFPLLALGDVTRRLPAKSSSLAEEAPDLINAAIVRVLSMRSYDGFAMWPDAGESSWPTTVYAAHFLVEAAQAGYPVSKATLDEAADQLEARLEMSKCEAPAYICHVLALAGRPNHGWLLRLFEQTHALSVEERCHLARALIRSGDLPKARGVLETVKDVSGLREAAFGLLAWLEIDPAAPFVAVCGQAIEKARREEGHWGTTQDNALALLALGTCARYAPPEPQAFAPVLGWQGGSLAVAATNAYTWAPGAAADRAAVRLKNQGPGLMYVTRRVACVPLASEVREHDEGVSVRREWHRQDGERVDPSKLSRGDLVIVSLAVDPKGAPLKDLVIEELLPACLELEDGDLAKAGTTPWISATEDRWVLHREARDDRLLLFSREISEPQTFHYAARVVTPGEFVVPAVSASAMYNPGIFSRSGLGRVTVK